MSHWKLTDAMRKRIEKNLTAAMVERAKDPEHEMFDRFYQADTVVELLGKEDIAHQARFDVKGELLRAWLDAGAEEGRWFRLAWHMIENERRQLKKLHKGSQELQGALVQLGVIEYPDEE